MSKLVLTSVKIKEDNFNRFKHLSIENKMSFQKLVERSLFLYATDEDFKRKINNTNIVELSTNK